MRASKKRILLLTAIVGVVVFLMLACITRVSHTIEITALDDEFRIEVWTTEMSMLPFTPEGPFPKSRRCTVLTAKGEGDAVTRDGFKFRQYTLGKNLESRFGNLYDCTICLSEANKTVVLEGALPASGTYHDVTVNRPEIITFTRETDIQAIDGRYVRARGQFKEWDFVADGRPLYVGNRFDDNSATYEAIGRIRAKCCCDRDRPCFHMFSSKRVADH
jgi:hypothetical protein